MKKNSILLFSLMSLLFLTGCEKELDFKYHTISPIPVIEGELTPSGVKVALRKTTPMAEPMNRTLYTDAKVSLEDLDTGDQIWLTPDEKGYFFSSVPGITGHTYKLSVDWEGKKYYTTSVMLPPTRIISLDFKWIDMPYDQVAVFQAQFEDNPLTSGDCYWVKIYRNGKIYKWMELDDRSAVNGVSTCMAMTTRRDLSEEDEDSIIEVGDNIDVTITQISREMHDYLEALQNDSNGPNMFSGDKCLGYFITSSPISDSIIFDPR